MSFDKKTIMDDQTSPSIPWCLQHKITLKGLLTCICTLLVLARVVLVICWYRSIIAPCIIFLINRWIIHSENNFFYNYHASKYTKDLFCRCELHFMTFVCTSTKHNVIEWCIFQTSETHFKCHKLKVGIYIVQYS